MRYSDKELEQADDFLGLDPDEQQRIYGKCQGHKKDEFLTKKYLLRDIENLSTHDICKVYKYVRRYLIAEIDGLVDPLEPKESSNEK